MSDQIEVGNLIKVVNTRGEFPSYNEWAQFYKLINFKNCSSIDNKFDNYKVICKGEHLTSGVDYYSEGILGIENTRTKQHYIILNSPKYITKILGQLEFVF